MAGLLITSIVSGQLISRFGRYKAFPIVGTAVMSVGDVPADAARGRYELGAAAFGSFVLGLGLGMVMQVLVLAVQNSVPHDVLGVATSGSTLFRQVGGSIGVSLFGAIFASRFRAELASRLPAGVNVPRVASPAVIRQLPPSFTEPSPSPSRRRCTPSSSSRRAFRCSPSRSPG